MLFSFLRTMNDGGAGTMPSDWSSFQKLTYLFVNNNRLGGALPNSLPRTLTAFFANDNDFTGGGAWCLPVQCLSLAICSGSPSPTPQTLMLIIPHEPVRSDWDGPALHRCCASHSSHTCV